VIGVQVGVDHHVDVTRVEPRLRQRGQEAGLQIVQHRDVGSLASVADAGVDEHRQTVDLDHPGLHHHAPPPDGGVVERRHQEVGVLVPRLRRRLAEHRRGDVELPLGHARHGGVAEPHPIHHGRP
jgi:hypothetical protein